MKYFLFLLFFIFLSCSPNKPIPECENGEVKESGDNYVFSCDSGYKLCRNNGEKFSCTNIDNTVKKGNTTTSFKCFSLTDIQGCLDGNPCHLPDKSSEAYKAMTYDAFEQRIEDSLEITCNPNYDPAANANKGKDDSTCSYKCAEVTNKLEYSDCNGDLEKLKSASEGDGCEVNIRDENLRLWGCTTCEYNYCNFDNEWGNGCEFAVENNELNIKNCEKCTLGYCNLDGDWSNGCEFNFTQPELKLNDCKQCIFRHCNFDGDWSNGCEISLADHEDLNLDRCEECKTGFCNADGDWSNGCEFKIEDKFNMLDCKICKPKYTNANGLWWEDGCEVLKPGNSPSDCGDSHINCHDELTDEEKKIYTATCYKDSSTPCGKVCNTWEGKGKKCGSSTCCPTTVECKGEACGCEIGHIKEKSCEDKKGPHSDDKVGYLQACSPITGDYLNLACEHNANCDGDVCGECHNGSTQCIQDEHGEYTIRQKCIDTVWRTGRNDCSDCRVYRCSFPNNNWWE